MPHLRLALAYRTEHRDPDNAVVLAAGTDRAALQAAIDTAPADLVRFEFGIFTATGKATRNSTHTPFAPAPDETHDNSGAGAPSPAAESAHQDAEGGAGDGDDDAPSVAPRRRR